MGSDPICYDPICYDLKAELAEIEEELEYE